MIKNEYQQQPNFVSPKKDQKSVDNQEMRVIAVKANLRFPNKSTVAENLMKPIR